MPIILGGGDFKKGIMVFKYPGMNGYDLAIIRLKKEFLPGSRFEIDDVENVQAVLHFCSLGVVQTFANVLNHIIEEWDITERRKGMEGEGKALDLIIQAVHGEMAKMQETCIQTMESHLEVIRMMIEGKQQQTPDSILERAVNTFGAEKQLWMVIEEMSELAKEICKHKRGENNADKIADETADCLIMLEQVKIIFGISREVQERIEYKLNRLQKRLEAAGGAGP